MRNGGRRAGRSLSVRVLAPYWDEVASLETPKRLVSGGGGAPTYVYRGEQDLQAYLTANAARKVRIEHLIKPGPAIADNPHHFLVVRVDGDRVSLEVVATGTTSFVPYGKRRIDLN